tara:strand:- start:61 stop:222 length:162 start_codon:yes stop_codon:yes gene_type:complete
MIKIKMFITMTVDEEEFPIPADGNVGEELEDTIQEYMYDVEGVEIKQIRTIQE